MAARRASSSLGCLVLGCLLLLGTLGSIVSWLKDHTTELLVFVVAAGTALAAVGLFARWLRRRDLAIAEQTARRDLTILQDATTQLVEKHSAALGTWLASSAARD